MSQQGVAQIIDGKKVAAEIKDKLKAQVKELKEKGIVPGLAVVIVGNNPASRIYVNSKKKACEYIGINSYEHALDEQTTQQQMLELVERLNTDPKVNGILIQLPLPKHIDQEKVLHAIDPKKDVDGFHPVNLGKLMLGNSPFPSCTPHGIMELIKRTGIELSGKECVVVGRSNIVGKPMAMLLLQQNATVTICHSKTVDLAEKCRNAHLIVAAVGKAGLIKGHMVKPGAVVIDVGMNRDSEGRLCGDVDFESVSKVASAITPVPGGVGPMTIAALMKNTINSVNGVAR